MTAIVERTTVDRATDDELAMARAVLSGLPVDVPLLRRAPRVPSQRCATPAAARPPVPADPALELLDVLDGARARLARTVVLLDGRHAEPVLR